MGDFNIHDVEVEFQVEIEFQVFEYLQYLEDLLSCYTI